MTVDLHKEWAMRLGDGAILDGYLAQVPGAAAPRARLIREDDRRRLLAGVADVGRLDAGAPLARAA